MKQFSCGDVVPGCSARWKGETEEEILGKVAEHAASAHDIDSPSPELVDAVRSCTSEV